MKDREDTYGHRTIILNAAFGRDVQHCLVSEFVEAELDGGGYGVGQLERAQQTADNVACAFGRLMQLFADEKLLTAEQIRWVVMGPYHADLQARFADEPPQGDAW